MACGVSKAKTAPSQILPILKFFLASEDEWRVGTSKVSLCLCLSVSLSLSLCLSPSFSLSRILLSRAYSQSQRPPPFIAPTSPLAFFFFPFFAFPFL